MSGDPDDAHRLRVTLIGGLAVLVVLAIAVWVFSTLRHSEDLNRCLAAGRRNCQPLDVPAREPRVFVPAH